MVEVATALITLLIIESQPAVARGLRLLMAAEPDLRVLGEAGHGEAGLRLVRDLRPDVVLMDIDCSNRELLAATGALRQIAGDASLILLTHLDNAQTDRLSQQVGAVAVVIKSSPPCELLEAIRQAAHVM